jgi:crotonobetaine/carnitine-CoA ligase
MAKGWADGDWQTLPGLLDERLSSDPNGPLFDILGTMYTASEIDDVARRMAGGLVELGVGPGVTVATVLENGPAAVLSWFAIQRLGAVAVPVNTALKGAFLRHQLADSAASVVIVQAGLADRPAEVLDSIDAVKHLVVEGEANPAPQVKAAVHRLDDLLGTAPLIQSPRVRPSDLAGIIYTGGTTGPSKGCALSHSYHLSIARQIATSWGRTPEDVVWTPLPVFHFNAVSTVITGVLLVGGRAALSGKFSVSGFWPEINRTGATIASLLGSLAALLATAKDTPQSRNSGAPEANTTLRLMTAAPLAPETDHLLRTRFGISTFSAGYGTTEASLIGWLPPGRSAKPNSAGVINDEFFDVRIFDDEDREMPRGTDGEIVCRPLRPHVMYEGYWKRPEATAEMHRSLWFHTGDIGRIDDNDYLFFVGRKADYLRRRGENISAWEVEKVFHEHQDVADVSVHAVPSDVGEDELKVTLVLTEGAKLTEEQLCRWAVDRLPYYAVPRYIEFRAALPWSETGRATKVILKAEGVTATTWDREAAGLSFERR